MEQWVDGTPFRQRKLVGDEIYLVTDAIRTIVSLIEFVTIQVEDRVLPIGLQLDLDPFV